MGRERERKKRLYMYIHIYNAQKSNEIREITIRKILYIGRER